MSIINEDYSDGNTGLDKMLPLNDLALSALLRSSLIARIKDQMIHTKATCQGWLMMNNGKNGKWVNRWVELRDTHVFYYKDSQSLDYLNVIDVDEYDIEDFAGKPYSFQATKCGEKSHYFCTHTIEEMKRWKKALKKAISSCKQKPIPLPKPGPISFYINEKQLHIDIPMGELYWWMEMLCDSNEAKKTVMKSFYRNDVGTLKSAVAIAIAIGGKTLIGHLECINNSIILKFDSLQESTPPIQYLFLENGKLQAALPDKENLNADEKQFERECSAKMQVLADKQKKLLTTLDKYRKENKSLQQHLQSERNDVAEIQASSAAKVTKMQSTIDELQSQLQSEKEGIANMQASTGRQEKEMEAKISNLQEQLRSEKESATKMGTSAEMKEKQLQEALDKHIDNVKTLEQMLQSEKERSTKAKSLAEEKQKELQLALEKGIKENDDLEKMVQNEKDNAARAQAMVDQKEKELQSALKELNILKNKLQMQPAQSTEGSNATGIIKPGKVHNLVALFSRSESNESMEAFQQKRRPFQSQHSLPERSFRN